MSFAPRWDVQSWGRVVRSEQLIASPRFLRDVSRLLQASNGLTTLAIGQRRSYGDSIFNTGGALIDMRGLDRFIGFDVERGVLRAEAGVTLAQIMRLIVPHGFFLPTTPGTRFVSLGGAIANDVHGKNHHRAGTFGCHLTRIGLLRSDGETELIPSDPLFDATIGGLGLTGIILWAEIRLQRVTSAFLDVDLIPYGNLDEFWALAESSTTSHEHTVAWIDFAARGRALGRGIFTRANWRLNDDRTPHDDNQPLSVPFEPPFCALTGFSMKAFNAIYWRAQKHKAGSFRQHYASFFYPLDTICGWNKLYGRRGFYQYQCVIPPFSMREAIAELVRTITKAGQGSALAVLKTCGARPSPGLLSFPMEGATLALDFANRGQPTLDLLARLDAIVREAKGRLYAAKDGRIPKEMWVTGYPGLQAFSAYIDPAFCSDFWRRVS